MSRYIVLNDPHVDVRAPSFRRRDDYFETCRRKLYHVADLCEQHKVEALLCTGDWFHKKHPQAVPHRLVTMLLEWTHYVTDHLGIPILTIIGNHDVPFNDTSLPSLANQPVGVLLTNRDVHLMDNNAWQLENAIIFGTSYKKALIREDGSQAEDLNQFYCAPYESARTWIVQMTHASVVPEPVMWHPHTPMALAMNASNADIMHTGHIHEDLGIHGHRRPNGDRCWWTNTGSMTRGSLTEETIARQPNVLLVELPTKYSGEAPKFTRLILPHEPAEQIYDVESYRENKVQQKEMSAWTENLRRELHGTSEEREEKTLEELVQESALDSAGRDLALRILNQAGA